ncbi:MULTISPECIES: sigma-54 interaction domain-containing protein [Bacillaceae]|uniref:Sigma-54-dependent Fis family transcriptional regulator n=1 Tax=Neobacillus mesonae TaxID=1193713 RepID=A0A3T0HSB6_9BACI|nr:MULTISPECIES: sigma 54-interacting transcriptional regulator [Bacillaceae]AZU59976.1 sigma-54-dependent Fis family transcriptional regulator [Neobacillus mesonae]MED0665602.1 sigma 54-interacting transcriptional regulator [Bacillus badius]MED4207007.1 sigma 54-interacting transcriptional regulator [Neobacillus mesonae]
MKSENPFAAETLQTLLTSLEEAISVINTQGQILYWNEAAERTYNIKKEDIIDKNIREFFQHEDIMHLRVLENQQPVRDMYHIPRPDKHVLISTTPIYNHKNGLIGSLSIEKDITSTIKLNEKLSSQSNELQELKMYFNQNNYDDPFSKIKGRNQSMQLLIDDTRKIAQTDAAILISGESGVGKELFAQAIHEKSLRNDKPLIAINCGAIPDALFESELFGYEEGAYTGAIKGGKPGKMELANGGTLFLDEVGELPLEMQVKLLRSLQDQEIFRIGGVTPKKVSVRVIAATNRNLEKMVSEGTFRADLYYRLNVFSVHIPPLRERKDDIPYLIHDFLREFSYKYNKPNLTIHNEATNKLKHYQWQGNIRELRNIIERLVVLEDQNLITENDIYRVIPNLKKDSSPSIKIKEFSLTDEKDQLEKMRIIDTLQNSYGNKSMTAKKLGITRATLYKKLRKYGIIYNNVIFKDQD